MTKINISRLLEYRLRIDRLSAVKLLNTHIIRLCLTSGFLADRLSVD